MKTRTALLGVSLLLFAVLGGWHLGNTKPETNPQPKAARSAPALTATVVAQAKVHPAESELNEFGLTSTTGIGVRVEAASSSKGGSQ
jgi:hypothetical protein